MTTAHDVIERRRTQQRALVDRARDFAGTLDAHLGVRAVVVFGSVARGDFHDYSDVDVLVVADHLPPDPRQRLAALGWPSSGPVEVLAWTPEELRSQRRRVNPIAVEADTMGIWLVGAPTST
jgi:hypothetical protein